MKLIKRKAGKLESGINRVGTAIYVGLNNNKGMEMVQVAILVAIAIGMGLIFKDRIGEFITKTFDSLMKSKF